MSPEIFCGALEGLGWSRAHLAARIQCNKSLPDAWAKGRASIPPKIAEWLGRLLATHQDLPPPQDWRTR
jgi:ribosome-binding protein aMBF1 (putative translation factor)